VRALKILIGLAALTGAYYAIITWLPEPSLRKYQTQWDENAARAQRFLFSSKPTAVVLAGSSLSVRIPEHRFEHCFANLALVGGAAIDSIELVRARSPLPRLILIEANTIERPADLQFFSEVNGFLPRHFRLFRVDAKPINFVLSGLYSVNHSKESELARQIATKADPRARNIWLDIQRRTYATPVEQALLNRQLTAYRKTITELKALGVQIAFFELPVDRTLRDSPRAAEIRKAVSGTFQGVDYFDLQDLESFRDADTTDGIHLSTSEALEVGDFLVERARLLLKEPDYCLSDPGGSASR
jgi:hypothetical protein